MRQVFRIQASNLQDVEVIHEGFSQSRGLFEPAVFGQLDRGANAD